MYEQGWVFKVFQIVFNYDFWSRVVFCYVYFVVLKIKEIGSVCCNVLVRLMFFNGLIYVLFFVIVGNICFDFE